MGQSLVKNYIHIIFNTKLREPLIHQPVQDEKKTFQDEYRAFLKKYKVEYDEQYIWD